MSRVAETKYFSRRQVRSALAKNFREVRQLRIKDDPELLGLIRTCARVTDYPELNDPGQPPEPEVRASPEVMSTFWRKHGLENYQIERLQAELARKDDSFNMISLLESKLASLRDALGVSSAAEIVYADSDLLGLDPELLLTQVQDLKYSLPGIDLTRVLREQPRLLKQENLRFRVNAVLNKLERIYPYAAENKRAEILQLVEDYPALLFRMEYYLHVRSVEQLPVDLQNCILKSYC